MPQCLRHTWHRPTESVEHEKATRSLASCLVLLSTHFLKLYQQDDVVSIDAVTHEPIQEPLGAYGLKEGCARVRMLILQNILGRSWPTLDRGVVPLHSGYYLL